MEERYKWKTKIFLSTDADKLELEINKFIITLDQDQKPDIKYSTCVDDSKVYFSAMILYINLELVE